MVERMFQLNLASKIHIKRIEIIMAYYITRPDFLHFPPKNRSPKFYFIFLRFVDGICDHIVLHGIYIIVN